MRPDDPTEDPTDDATDDLLGARVTRVVHWVAGVVLLVIVAVAGAGLILALDHPPDESGRPELTARGHQIVAPRLAAMDADLVRLAAAGDAIAEAGRHTLTRLRALDPDGVDQATAAGDVTALDAATLHASLVGARAALLDGTALDRLPVSDRIRIGALDTALPGAGELAADWAAVRLSAGDPTDLVRSIQAHDTAVVRATDAGRAGRWQAALDGLVEAQRLLVPAHAVAATAARAGSDVATLQDLLDRMDTYDAALVDLYTLLQTSDGKVTNEVRDAYAEVEAAQESLPVTEDALVISVSDLAAAAITRALLDIESARGQLRAALDAAGIGPMAGATPSPATSPGAATPPAGVMSPGPAVSSPASSASVAS